MVALFVSPPPAVPFSVGAMRQRILGSHTPPCHRRMVITTPSSMVCLAALQRKPDQCPFLWGGGGEKLPCLPRHGPGGGGWPSSTCAAEAAASAPCAPPRPRGMGVGVDRCPLLLPPPLGGTMPSPVADDPACAAVSRREMSPKISASPREGGGGCGRGCDPPPPPPPPPRVCVRPGALPALVAPAAVPRTVHPHQSETSK